MKLSDLKNFLKEDKGNYTSNIYVPSIKRDLPFKPITTADVKTLTRIGVIDSFDLNNELLKLSLFDKLSIETKESCGVDSENITPIDYLSFLIGIRKLLNNELKFSFTCKSCGKKFENSIDLETKFESYIYGYERKNLTYEKMDNQNNIWKFELTSFTMKDYIYFRYYIDKLSDIDTNHPDVINESLYSRPILYIKALYKNDEPIEDWNESILPAKIQAINLLPSEVIVDTTVSDKKDSNSCLANFIAANFDEEKILMDVKKMKVTCPHCNEEYDGIFKFDDFFMF